MKRFAKSRKYLHLLLCCIGASMTMTTVSSLLRYHDASERYRERFDPILDRMIESNPTPQSMAERPDLFSDLHSLRFGMESSQISVHADLLIFGGLGLLALGLFLQKKDGPKPQAATPPTHAWDSVPTPILVKRESSAPRP
jgi:hypothetical protein